MIIVTRNRYQHRANAWSIIGFGPAIRYYAVMVQVADQALQRWSLREHQYQWITVQTLLSAPVREPVRR